MFFGILRLFCTFFDLWSTAGGGTPSPFFSATAIRESNLAPHMVPGKAKIKDTRRQSVGLSSSDAQGAVTALDAKHHSDIIRCSVPQQSALR
jgi:hypothetical protein